MDRIKLHYKDSTLTIIHPGKVYKRSRFDWNGIIDQVNVGNISFLGQEAYGDYSGTEGIGLSSEFGMNRPPGYRKTLPGRYFMKIGVGALQRKSLRSYNFMSDYAIRPFETRIRANEKSAVFSQMNCINGSYGYDYTKEISLGDREVNVSYHLINRGHLALKTEEYCHNFFRPGGQDISSSMVFSVNHDYRLLKTVGPIDCSSGSKVSFGNKPDSVFYMRAKLKESPSDFSWSLEDQEKGITVRGVEDFPVSTIALWGMSHVISPETFHVIKLMPGEDIKWNRRYSFEI